MPAVQQIQYSQDEVKRLHKIVNVVIPTLSELYGAPTWMTKPKEDQNSSEILRQWAVALGGYSEHQLKTACLKYYKYNKSAGFPTLGKLSSELCEENQEDYVAPIAKSTNCWESLESKYMKLNATSSLYVKCLHNDYTRAIKYIIDELLPERIGSNEYKKVRNDYSAKVELAQKNCLFTDFNSTLLMIYNRHHGIAEQRMNNGNFEF